MSRLTKAEMQTIEQAADLIACNCSYNSDSEKKCDGTCTHAELLTMLVEANEWTAANTCAKCGSTEGAYVPPGSADASCLHCGADWPSDDDEEEDKDWCVLIDVTHEHAYYVSAKDEDAAKAIALKVHAETPCHHTSLSTPEVVNVEETP